MRSYVTRLTGLLLVAVGAAACGEPRFEVRDLKPEETRSEYGSFITGTLIQTQGSSADDYIVLLRIKRIAGGDPSRWPSDTTHDLVWVTSGFGRVSYYATGEDRSVRIAVTPVGFLRFRDLPGK